MRKVLFTFGLVFIVLLSGCNTDELTNLETEISSLEDDISALQLALSEIEDYDDALLQEEVTSLQEEIEALEEDVLLLNQNETILVSEIDDLLGDITSLRLELLLLEDFNLSIAPVFSNVPANQVIEYETNLDLLALGITAYDNLDEDVTSSITTNIDDTSILTLGNHAITYSVTDSDGNIVTQMINLEVVVSDEDLSFVLINEGTEIKITGFSGYEYEFVGIPNTIGGLPVTVIGENAFRSKGITNLFLNNNLNSIENYAFYDNDIMTVSLPNTVTDLGIGCFAMNGIYDLILSTGLIEIASYAFEDNELTSVSIPSNITTIGRNAFAGNYISSLTIPNTVTILELGAFKDNNISTLNLGVGITVIEMEVFAGNSLTHISFGDQVTEIKYGAFRDNNITSVTISSFVVTIGNTAFDNNPFTFVLIQGVENRFNDDWLDIGFPIELMPPG